MQLTGRANVELETTIAAAEQFATWMLGTGGINVAAPSSLGVDLALRHRETIGAWFSADVNGPLDANTVIYAEPGTTSSTEGAGRLTISASLLERPQRRLVALAASPSHLDGAAG